MAAPAYLDTGIFWSFAVVDGLAYLRSALDGQALWTEAVRAEVERNRIQCLQLWNVLSASWLRAPVRLEGELGTQALRLRDAMARGTDPPRKHLGEAESIIAALNHGILTGDADHATAAFGSDDGSARRMARARGLVVVDTEDLIRTCVQAGHLTCDEALQLHRRMVLADRKLDCHAGVHRLCGDDHLR